ncbi:MAG: hypothetical protein HQ521_12590 [Bacteroidetes bacterium]|nr:hypothetical protein [Bacteroidota bacterium]
MALNKFKTNPPKSINPITFPPLFPKNKKAVFFTLLTISLLSLFILSYSIYSTVERQESISKRIKTMNNFVFLVEEDLQRQLYISGFRIIFLIENEIVNTGTYISNVNTSFQEGFYNGTISGVPNEIMNDVTFQGIIIKINEKASKINIHVNLSNPEIEITQKDPWNVKINFSANLFITDNEDLANWNKTYTKEINIPVKGFADPLYIVNTNSLISNIINQTPYTTFVSGTNVANLTSHLNNPYYKASTSAPSFLDRLEGKTTPNTYGIESLVYIPDLPSFAIKSKSVVDHIYFSTSSPSTNQIQGMPSWFLLDVDHQDDYGVEGIIV